MVHAIKDPQINLLWGPMHIGDPQGQGRRQAGPDPPQPRPEAPVQIA